MGKSNLFTLSLFFIIFFSTSTYWAQNISNSVLQSDNYERVYPEPYLDTVNDIWIHPPYTDPKTGKVYEHKDVSPEFDPYIGGYSNYYDDKIEPIGWSKDGKFYYAIHNYGYYEEDLWGPSIQYYLIDVTNNKLLDYDTILNKNICSEHNIDLKAELKQFPLNIYSVSGDLTELIDVNNYKSHDQKLTFSSTKNGEVLIKDNISPYHEDEGGCPDEVKGYFISPDEKYFIAVFYANGRITGAGDDPCEAYIYFKILNLETFQIIEDFEEKGETLIENRNDSTISIYSINTNLRNSKDFTIFIKHFIETVYSNINFDSLVYNSSPQIKEYVNGNHGGRFWNIGAACELYEVFNHSDYRPESGKNPDLNQLEIISNKSLVFDFCEVAKNPDAIYFREIESLPGHENVSENKYIEAPKIYNDLKKILVEIVVDGILIERFYFVDFSNKWFLLYIDDCGCDP